MVTKAEVTEYVNAHLPCSVFGGVKNLSPESDSPWTAAKYGIVQEWMSPEVAIILQKLVGDAYIVERIARNRSNTNDN